MTKDQPERGVPPVLASLIWGLFCLVMWFWAIVGPIFVVAGAVSYYVDLRGFLSIPGWEALSLGIVLGAVGITFVWLRMWRYIRFMGE
jgi:hypothetical protein